MTWPSAERVIFVVFTGKVEGTGGEGALRTATDAAARATTGDALGDSTSSFPSTSGSGTGAAGVAITGELMYPGGIDDAVCDGFDFGNVIVGLRPKIALLGFDGKGFFTSITAGLVTAAVAGLLAIGAA